MKTPLEPHVFPHFQLQLKELASKFGLNVGFGNGTEAFVNCVFTLSSPDASWSESRQKFEGTHSYKDLLKDYALSENGTWEIYGEDPNCDMGGSHVEPKLETVEGKLDDVVNYGVKLKGFWQWGAGGRFKKVTIRPVKKVG